MKKQGIGVYRAQTSHCEIYPSPAILAVPWECTADPAFLPCSEPDSWVPARKAFLPLSLFSLVSFLLMLVSLGAQCFLVHGSGACWCPGNLGSGMGAACEAAMGGLALLNKGRFLKGMLWETVLAEMGLCVRTAGSCQGS